MFDPVVATRQGALSASAVSPTTVPRMSSVVMADLQISIHRITAFTVVDVLFTGANLREWVFR
jgi:hypothetical protein